MKIKTNSAWEKKRDETVTQYADRCLDGSDYGSGQLEAIARGNEKTSAAIGRLLNLLATKGIVTAPEVTEIVEGNYKSDAIFIAE